MINSRYILQKKLGQGRSTVYSVIDTEFPEREVAAKFLPVSASDEERASFREEYFKLNKLDHPNIIKAYEYGKVFELDAEDTDINLNSLFFSLEHFGSLELLNYPYLNDEKKLRIIIRQICSVLYYLHLSNYIYYDLKPENILVSESNGFPQIRIIDLGLSDHKITEKEFAIRGTAYYIAPELLKREEHDHSVDLYSLGMILYRIVFKKFPFNKTSELEIYKAHIEQKFEFPQADYSEELINVIKKLLEKEPSKRCNSALQILQDLGEKIDIDLTQNFLPAKVLSGRKDALNIVGTYLKDVNSNEVFAVRGFDGSGKTALMQEIYQKYSFAVSIDNTKTKSGLEAIKYIFKKLAFSESIYPLLNEEQRGIIKQILSNDPFNISDSLKSFFSQLNNSNDVLLLFDDFNLYDNYSAEILNEIMPLLQVKKIKVIVSESSDHDYKANKINNLQEIQLTQLTEYQLTELLDLSYYDQFSKAGLKKIILLYADLLPGNIKQFIKDIIILKVMRFNAKGVEFVTNEELDLVLQSTNEEIYRLRLSNISAEELKLAQIISTFQVSVEQTILAALMDTSIIKLKNLLDTLVQKNIIDPLNFSNAPQINSDSFKKYIYSTINNVKKVHVVIANSINRLFPDFNPVELSRQFELAGEFEKSADMLKKEIEKAEKVSSYSYKRSLLEHLLQLNLKPVKLTELRVELVKTLYKLSDYKTALDSITKIDLNELKKDIAEEILFIKGSSLVNLRSFEKGKTVLTELNENGENKLFIIKASIELAYLEFDLNYYESSEKLTTELLRNDISDEERGKCLNLLGMINFYGKNDINISLEYFNQALDCYEKAQLPTRISGMQQNIGIIYFELNKDKEVIKYWDKALDLNEKIGNLEQQGLLYLNYGVFYQRLMQPDTAIEKFHNAKSIFSALGSLNNLALCLSNMGESYLDLCEYQSSYENLNESVKIFKKINNKLELIDALFILGKFWFVLGDKNEIIKVKEIIEKIILELDDKTPRHNALILILDLYIKMSSTMELEDNEITKLISTLTNLSEDNLIVKTFLYLSEYLVSNDKEEIGIDILSNTILQDKFNKYLFIHTYLEYLYGKAALNKKIDGLNSPLEHFEKAYSLLDTLHVTELTWKILFNLAVLYDERGNLFKAKKPKIYCEELLRVVAEHITSSKIRRVYLGKTERKNAITRLKSIDEKYQVNEFQKN